MDSKKMETLYLIYLMFSCFLCDYFCDLLRFKRFSFTLELPILGVETWISIQILYFTAILTIMQYNTTRIDDE